MSEQTVALDEVLPAGVSTLLVAEREPGAGSLQQEVTAVTWELTVPGVVDVVQIPRGLAVA